MSLQIKVKAGVAQRQSVGFPPHVRDFEILRPLQLCKSLNYISRYVMDKNKEKVLVDTGYTIHRTCGNCEYSNLHSMWGTCIKHQYAHLKHKGGEKSSTRDLSINAHGSCSGHKYSSLFINTIHGFDRFLDK